MLGTIRIKSSNLKPVKLTKVGYRQIKITKDLENVMNAIKLFKGRKNLKILIDKKDPRFLKGQLMPDGKCMGARITVLPNGKQINKAYSLFAKNLTIHDETSNEHWDVMFLNPGGTSSYVYTVEKNIKHNKQKYKKVELFQKHYIQIKRKVKIALNNKDDYVALPMYTLLKTYMRIGNETYYKANGHKGLTTLKKDDIKINGNTIEFTYLSKGGVPRKITQEFPPNYVKRLTKKLKPLKKSSFVFTNSEGKTLKDRHFMKAFKKYCGKEFYPHIVRSHFATSKAKEFLKKHKKTDKIEINAFFSSIAQKLGHKKFDKKNKVWKESHNITINYYIAPETVKSIKKLVEN
jgi:DNA topoisomerase IB